MIPQRGNHLRSALQRAQHDALCEVLLEHGIHQQYGERDDDDHRVLKLARSHHLLLIQFPHFGGHVFFQILGQQGSGVQQVSQIQLNWLEFPLRDVDRSVEPGIPDAHDGIDHNHGQHGLGQRDDDSNHYVEDAGAVDKSRFAQLRRY